jgi:DNA polymerase I-like protein with 3'-5' exonuclease and polymerase domains
MDELAMLREEEEDPACSCLGLVRVPARRVFRLSSSSASAAAHLRPFRASLRDCVLAPPGCILLSGDYKATEARILAHLCGDARLRSALESQRSDFFSAIACDWLGLRECSEAQRSATKQVMYGIVYGAGLHVLQEALGCSQAEAARKLAFFHAHFPGIQRWKDEVLREARASGCVIRSLWGRARALPDLCSSSPALRAAAQRCAINTICQASAADVMAVAMRRVALSAPEGVAVVLQIHDELLLECPAERAGEVAGWLRREMLAAGEEKGLRLQVALTAGPSWGRMQAMEGVQLN